MKKLILLITLSLLSGFVFSDCPEGTWNRNQYTGPGGGMYTGPGGGLYTGPGLYCTNRPPLQVLLEIGIISY